MARAHLVIAMALMSLWGAPAAQASFGFAPGSLKIEALRPGGEPDLRAGGHPDRLKIDLAFNTVEGKADGNAKDLEVELPAGLVANGGAFPACPRTVFDGGECPAESRVGTVMMDVGTEKLALPVFNVEPAPGQAAELGASLIVKIPMTARLRRSDGGTMIEMADLSQAIPMAAIELELWGVPADHQSGTGLARHPFLTLPTSCAPGGLSVTIRARSWQQPDVWHEEHASTGEPLEGCDLTPFDPGVGLRLSNPLADSPTGVELDLETASSDDPDGRGSPPIEDVSLMLPEGMTVSPGGAQSVAACSDADFAIDAESSPVCPPASKVGSVEIVTPVLRAPVTGTVYLGEEHPGERLRVLVAADLPGGRAKLSGVLNPDPETGRLAFELRDLPRLPLTRMTLRFNGGPRALLATPLDCGVGTASATFVAYDSGARTTAHAGAMIAPGAGTVCGAELPFQPAFSAGTLAPRAGRGSALSITLRRSAGEQLPEGFRIGLPVGLTARLGAVQRCAATDVATGNCPVGSRIGSAVAEIGSGPVPAGISGDAYLTGPRKGAPFGLALVFHPRFGPFDIGLLAVRSTMRIDPRDGRIAIETDPLPQIVAGIPIRFRSIGLDIDRPGFIGNPTSCHPSSFETSVRAVDGRIATMTKPFAVRGCNSQPFHPSLSLGILGRGLNQGDRVGFRIAVRMPSPTTNLRGASIPLPSQLQFQPSGLKEVCASRAVFKAKCPAGSRVGTARALTPLLPEPLTGSVYVVQPSGNGLPDLWIILEDQGIRVAVRTKLTSRHGRTVAHLVGVPDFPLSALRMTLTNGDSGILSLREGLCAQGRSAVSQSVVVGLEGQDGAYIRRRVGVAHRACGVERQARSRRHHRGAEPDDRD